MTPRQMLEMADAITVVIDRTASAQDVDVFHKIGGGWATGIDLWRMQSRPYLILCAATRRRVKYGAPLVILADDVQIAAAAACDQLDDVKCAWLFATSNETRDRVLEVTLADAVIGGSA